MGITGSTYVFDYYELNYGVWCLKDAWLLWKKNAFVGSFLKARYYYTLETEKATQNLI